MKKHHGVSIEEGNAEKKSAKDESSRDAAAAMAAMAAAQLSETVSSGGGSEREIENRAKMKIVKIISGINNQRKHHRKRNQWRLYDNQQRRKAAWHGSINSMMPQHYLKMVSAAWRGEKSNDDGERDENQRNK